MVYAPKDHPFRPTHLETFHPLLAAIKWKECLEDFGAGEFIAYFDPPSDDVGGEGDG